MQAKPSPYGVQPSPLRTPGPAPDGGSRLPVVVGIGVLLLCVVLTWRFCRTKPLPEVGRLPAPVQKTLEAQKQLPSHPGYRITTRHSYRIKALILARKRYSDGVGAKFAPVDFALGWGIITMKPYVNAIEWSQRGRWYNYRYGADMPLSNQQISLNSANTHIVPHPQKAGLRKRLLGFRRGDLVELRGYLVQIRANKGGWRWFSSLKRTDTRGGSCEVFYVTEAQRLPLPR